MKYKTPQKRKSASISPPLPYRRRKSLLRRRKREDGEGRKQYDGHKKRKSSSSMFSLSLSCMSKDLLLYIMSYIVSENGVVDGMTFQSVSSLSKQWHALINTPCLWSNHTTFSRRRQCSIQDETIAGHLIGFKKLDTFIGEQNEVSYRVLERATQKKFVLRVIPNISNRHDIIHNLAISHQLLGHDLWADEEVKMISDFSKRCHEHFLLPVGDESFPLKSSTSSLLLWYHNDSYHETLKQWYKKRDHELQETEHKVISLEQIQDWFCQLLEGLFILQNYCGNNWSQSWNMQLENLYRDSKTGRLRLLLEGNNDGKEEIDKVSKIAHLLLKIFRRGKSLPRIPSANNKLIAWLQQQVPDFPDVGIDFLYQIFSSSVPITAKEALEHPFVAGKNDYKSIMEYSLTPLQRLRERERMMYHVQTNVISLNEHAVLVDWLAEMCYVFDFSKSVLHRAVLYFDRVLREIPIGMEDPEKFQLIAGTCFMIATKVENSPKGTMSMSDIAFCADNSFGQKDILWAEKCILEILKWELSDPTIMDFVLQHTSNCRQHEIDMMLYVSQLSLLLPLYPSSFMAANAMIIAMHTMHGNRTTISSYFEKIPLTHGDKVCVNDTCASLAMIRERMPHLKATSRSFSTSNGVSDILIPHSIFSL